MNDFYYRTMLKRKRFMPIYSGSLMKGFITFYITNNIDKYVNSDPYVPLPDDSQGKILYIAQLFTDKKSVNPKMSYRVWRDFKNFIKNEFPLVETICWRRWDRKSKGVKTYSRRIQSETAKNIKK